MRRTNGTHWRSRIDASGRTRRVRVSLQDHKALVDAKVRAARKAAKHRARIMEVVA